MRALSLLILTPVLLIATAAGANPGPEQVIHRQSELLLERISVEQTSDATSSEVETLVAELVAPHVDFAMFSKLVLGKHWRSLSVVDQKRFERGMMRLVVKTYAAALTSASGLSIEYLELQEDNNPNRVTVPTIVRSTGSPPISVDYRLHEKDGVWKVYDVAIEGVSMAINYRAVMATQIRSQGIEAVIDDLSERPDTLAAQ